ncbi:endonuclease/exonuclease/phosphatase family protein [Microbacterium sp. H1-D42]|uniref:endonuclease/exonuclease/phosphatase family protein n=1 Tax=Microbacterium sp. H1-D42 TaxID=2925844 RepID=UPI001F52B5AC|nr:endonuclease/exonuclease/phosphatase family protein [Microbacterium sp. H1-D42]UNK71121.1 hypothetical protein MNR00_01355 [Microbacterium sp. H1-D42]
MRRLSLSLVGIVAAWLLIDFWRLWTPSLITLFGQAAETPPEIMGAFALAVMAAPLVVVAFVSRPAPVLAAWLLIAAFAVRIVTRMNPVGGDVQLYGSSIGVLLVVAVLCLCAGALGRTLVPSVFVGVAVSTATHAMLGGYGAVWRSDAWDIGLLIVQAVLLAFAVRGASDAPREPVSPRTAVLLLPTLLLVLLALGNVGRASTIDTVWGPSVVVIGTGATAVVALLPSPRQRPWIAAALLVASLAVSLLVEVDRAGFEGSLTPWALIAFAVGPAAAARMLLFAGPGHSVRLSALGAGIGSVIWTALFFAYYAGYDLGYRADLVIVVAAVAMAAWVLAYRAGGEMSDADERAAERRMDDSGARAVAGVAVGAVAATAVALVAPFVTVPTVDARPAAADDELSVTAYNVRMGYGLDGRFDPIAVAEQIRSSGAHVVLLSEVDRGWLLNGGQDQLSILARMLDMRVVFGPAADPVWGDAILTDLPMSDASSTKYPMFDALTGAAYTSATVTWDGKDVSVIATHLQPDGNETDATDRQAALFADAITSADSPVIAGGDLNTTRGSAAWATLMASGAEDAFADASEKAQIDHLLLSGMSVTDAEVVESHLSDHPMITATVK